MMSKRCDCAGEFISGDIGGRELSDKTVKKEKFWNKILSYIGIMV